MPREAVWIPFSEGLKPPWVKSPRPLSLNSILTFFEQCIALCDLPSWIILWLILKNREYNIPKCLDESIYYSFNGSSTSFILHFFKGSYSFWVTIQDETVVLFPVRMVIKHNQDKNHKAFTFSLGQSPCEPLWMTSRNIHYPQISPFQVAAHIDRPLPPRREIKPKA